MCGVVGWVLPSQHALSERLLVSLAERQKHRGPDSAGHWIGFTRDDKWQIGLSFRRLAFLDLSPAGSQPMFARPDTALVFNGEIYNYIELRERVATDGWESTGDTVVLLNLLAQDGLNCLPLLRGMFAFAFWNGSKGELLLARDPFGKKPLYVAELDDGGVVFGSEIDAIAAMPGLDRSVDGDAVPEYLQYRYVPGPNTFFRKVKKLPPGHWMRWKAGRTETGSYYTPPFRNPRAKRISSQKAETRLIASLREAVSIRLRSEAPFGLFLSGGLDSSLILALMTEQLAHPVTSFSVGFNEGEHSELHHARRIADRFGADHNQLVVSAESVIHNLAEATRHRGAPVSEPSDLAILMLSKVASRKVKMVLTGEGADELLGGYPKHRADAVVAAFHAVIPAIVHDRLIDPLIRRFAHGARRATIVARALRERDEQRRFALWFGATTEAEREQLLFEPRSRRPIDPYPWSSRASRLKRMLFLDQTSWLPDNLLERGDRMMMAGSIEGRMPFMDTEVARVVASFPDRLLIGGRGGKTVLRRAAKRLLPRDTLTRPKIGFRVPVDVWFRTSLREYLRDNLLGTAARTRSILKEQAVRRLLNEHVEGTQNHEKLLWTLLALEIFAQVHGAEFGDADRMVSEGRVSPVMAA